MDKLWKAAERKIAKLLGGERIPVSGRQRGFSADIAHDEFSIEVKHRQSLPDWILEATEQAEASQRGEQIPLVVLHKKGVKYEDSLAILRVRDIIKLSAAYRTLKERGVI